MGKIKELITDENVEMLDADFQYDAFLASAVPVSNCCGADMNKQTCEDGPSFIDLERCPDCKEHCSIELN